MKGKILFSRSISKIFFVLLYTLDIRYIYYLTGDLSGTVIGAAAILAILTVWMGMRLLALKAHPIQNACSSDADYLQARLDEVKRKIGAIGRKQKNIHLWIADNDSLNCYTVGNHIIVNRSMLQIDKTMLEACLAHEYSHVLNHDSIFRALLECNILAGLIFLGISILGAAVTIVIIVTLIFGLIFSAWIGFTVGVIFSKIIKCCFHLATHAYYYVCKVFSAFLYRRQELEADRLVALLGYAHAMLRLIQLNERMHLNSIQPSWVENLLNDHPSDYRRINQLKKIEEEIAKLEEAKRHTEFIPYENPFEP